MMVPRDANIRANAPWPHQVLTSQLYRYEDNVNPILLDEVHAWCAEHLVGKWETMWAAPLPETDPRLAYIGFIKAPTVAVPVMVFDDDKDAILFALRWSGQ